MFKFGLLRTRWALSTGSNLAATVAVALLGLASMVVLARNLPVPLFGAINLAILIMNSITAFDGIRPVTILRMAPGQPKSDTLFGSSMAYSVAMGVLIGLPAYGIAWGSFGYGSAEAALLGLACFLHFPAAAIASFLDARGGTLFTGVIRSLGWCILFSAHMALAQANVPLWPYVGGLVAFQLMLLGAYGARLANRAEVVTNLRLIDTREVTAIARESTNMIGFNLAALIMGVADRFTITHLLGLRSYGFYSASYDLALRPTAFFRVLSTVALPEMVERGHMRIVRRWWMLLLASFGVTALGALVIAAWREELLVLALGEDFRVSAVAFGVLAATLPLFALSYFAAVLCQASGALRLQRQVFAWGALALCIILYPLVTWFGLSGAAVAVLASRFVDPLLIALLLRKLGISPPIWRSAGALVLYLLAVLTTLEDQPLAAIACCVFLSALLYDLHGTIGDSTASGGAGDPDDVESGRR